MSARATGLTLRVALPLLGAVASLLLWQGLAAALGPYRLPTPTSLWPGVFQDLTHNQVLEFQGGGSDGLLPHLLYTLRQTLLGCLIGGVVGISLGLLMGRFVPLRRVAQLPVEVLRTVPPLAAAPFLLIWFGPTAVAQTSVVGFYTAVMLTVTTLAAIASLDPIYHRAALVLGAGENRYYRTVVLPAIVPFLSGGVRVAVGVAWGIEVVSELMGAPKGMGQVFDKMVSFSALDVIIVGIFWITVVAAIVDLLLVLAIRHLTRWVPRTT
jgi:ABC-type nitrate/sulfonate/bicarbonate transport system permease component